MLSQVIAQTLAKVYLLYVNWKITLGFNLIVQVLSITK